MAMSSRLLLGLPTTHEEWEPVAVYLVASIGEGLWAAAIPPAASASGAVIVPTFPQQQAAVALMRSHLPPALAETATRGATRRELGSRADDGHTLPPVIRRVQRDLARPSVPQFSDANRQSAPEAREEGDAGAGAESKGGRGTAPKLQE